MDYLNAGWTPKLIPGWLRLTQEQLNAALSYIEEHPSEVEAEYQTVVQTSEEIPEYWKAKNRDLFARIAAMPPKPGQKAIRAKIQAHKAKRGMTA